MRTFTYCENCGKPARGAHRLWCGKDHGPRFWAKVDRRGPRECWPWTGAMISKGYGMFGLGRKARTASRVAWELTNGPIPDGLCILHNCDNAACVNPGHLRLGTQVENMLDMRIRNRVPGTLNREQVLQVREMLNMGDMTGAEIARELDIHPGTVSSIKRGRSYAYFQ